jgi:hypothetical protein
MTVVQTPCIYQIPQHLLDAWERQHAETERWLNFKPGTYFYNGRTAKGRARRS